MTNAIRQWWPLLLLVSATFASLVLMVAYITPDPSHPVYQQPAEDSTNYAGLAFLALLTVWGLAKAKRLWDRHRGPSTSR